jgi:hypothetical protein
MGFPVSVMSFLLLVHRMIEHLGIAGLAADIPEVLRAVVVVAKRIALSRRRHCRNFRRGDSGAGCARDSGRLPREKVASGAANSPHSAEFACHSLPGMV